MQLCKTVCAFAEELFGAMEKALYQFLAKRRETRAYNSPVCNLYGRKRKKRVVLSRTDIANDNVISVLEDIKSYHLQATIKCCCSARNSRSISVIVRHSGGRKRQYPSLPRSESREDTGSSLFCHSRFCFSRAPPSHRR